MLQIQPGRFFGDHVLQLLLVFSAILLAALCQEMRCRRFAAVARHPSSLPSTSTSSATTIVNITAYQQSNNLHTTAITDSNFALSAATWQTQPNMFYFILPLCHHYVKA